MHTSSVLIHIHTLNEHHRRTHYCLLLPQRGPRLRLLFWVRQWWWWWVAWPAAGLADDDGGGGVAVVVDVAARAGDELVVGERI